MLGCLVLQECSALYSQGDRLLGTALTGLFSNWLLSFASSNWPDDCDKLSQ